PPLAHAQPVRKRPRPAVALERRDRRRRRDLPREHLDAALVETQPVEGALVDTPRSRRAVGAVRLQDARAPLSDELRGPFERVRNGRVRQERRRTPRRRRLLLHLRTKLHRAFILGCEGGSNSRSTSREAEGTGPVTPRQPAPPSKVPS